MIPAASIATSVPVPIAIPTSALASAGASLIAVAHHRHPFAFGFQSRHFAFLVLGQYFGHYVRFFDPDLAGDRLRGFRPVARDHPDLGAHRP